jgi:hypothetical protein
VILATAPSASSPAIDEHVRILRWTFRRDDETVICELGLTRDDSAYELRIQLPWNATGTAAELFDDAVAAFQRHAVIERTLVNDGWSLESFESRLISRRSR